MFIASRKCFIAVSRKLFTRPPTLALMVLAGVLVLALLAGCGGTASTEAPGTTDASGTTTSTDVSTTGSTAGTPVRGGIISVGTQTATNLDPHFSNSISDIMLNHQIYDFLVFVDEANNVVPALATNWDSPDAKVWSFELRSGVTFHNGQPLTADDVVYSFNRLRDQSVGAPTASLYSNIVDVKAVDPTHVEFDLAEANPEFPADAGDYHAAILCKSVADPKTEQVGSGPFMLESYKAEDRAVLKKNPNYWMEGADGQPLPYLDGVDFIFSPDQGAQVEALRGGQLQFVLGLSTELAQAVASDPSLQLLKNASNMHYVIHMRSDAGHPAAEEKVRQALKLATDSEAIIAAVRPDLAVVGNGTPVGPMYQDYYLDQAPEYDVEKAKTLLAEAGYTDSNPLKITLYAQNALDVPAIATVWREQMAAAGVQVDIQTVPSDVYYGEGDASWLKVDFGVTEWGTRATPVAYFKLAYVTDAEYNESHWSDAEFDEVVSQIEVETVPEKRIELYKQAQQILIERGPVIVPYVVEAAAGASADLQGVVFPSDMARTLFREAYLTK